MTSVLSEGTLGKYTCLRAKLTEPSVWPNGAWGKAPPKVTHFSAATNQYDGKH